MLTCDRYQIGKWIEPFAQSVGAQILISDDADSFKKVADEAELLHQVCKSHVKRNTQALLDEFRPLVEADVGGSLATIGVMTAQILADLERLDENELIECLEVFSS